MARIIKAAADRKNELIDCAEALFFEKGYDATTVADILARARLSKGAFYHHFESKEELLDALTDRITRSMIASARDILEDETLDALTRLNRFLARGGQWKRQTAPRLSVVYATIFKPENAVLYQRMVGAAVTALTPVLTKIVEQGAREGTFDVPDPTIVSEVLLHIVTARQSLTIEAVQMAFSGELDRAADLLEQRIAVEQKVIDRILAVPEGSVVLFAPGYIRTMLGMMIEAEEAFIARSAA